MHCFKHLFTWCLALMLMAPHGPAMAQSRLSNAQLDQLTAPVALYPDALLSQVLMAATYPADVAAAAQWSKANPSLSGDAATYPQFFAGRLAARGGPLSPQPLSSASRQASRGSPNSPPQASDLAALGGAGSRSA